MNKNNKLAFNPMARHNARRLALQALYQLQIAGNNLSDIESHLLIEQKIENVDVPYFQKLFRGVALGFEDIDGKMVEWLDRSKDDLDPVELAILRIGMFELLHCPEIPYKVVINESLLLAKKFGAQDGYKYINGVLDRAARSVRVNEIS